LAIKLTDLKKSLKELDQKELIQLVSDLYKVNNEVKDYLSSRFLGERAIEEQFKKAAKKIRDEFFPDRGHGKLRLAEAKKAISNFQKTTADSNRTIELMLYYVELGTEFTAAFGDIDESFYSSMLSMYDKVAIECDKDEELYIQLRDRLYSVVRMSDEVGWGYPEAICDIYYTIEWVGHEDE
jgi:hypothetical protein